ncbi:hypothetical protein [uncultured Brevundimonas sp.]|uniref:hypothetical protein n=1 Tax=uncultured Brevundimonas sp. TaxID=213418 RepID=UPI0026267633|nr:hypothetical protein [uncultured Brevundimonas sp.]
MTEAEAIEIVERYQALVIKLARQPEHRNISDEELTDGYRAVIINGDVQLQSIRASGDHNGADVYFEEPGWFEQNPLSTISLSDLQTHSL